MNDRLQLSRTAFSLLEVVVGLVLMASVLGAVLVAYGQQSRHQLNAKEKLQAVDIAEDMLVRWFSSQDGIPPQSNGSIPGHANWMWQTNVVRVQELMGVAFPVVRLEIVDYQNSKVGSAPLSIPRVRRNDALTSRGMRVLAQVEVVGLAQ